MISQIFNKGEIKGQIITEGSDVEKFTCENIARPEFLDSLGGIIWAASHLEKDQYYYDL